MIPLENILLRPVTSEKSIEMATTLNAYTFEIALCATKDDVRDAVIDLLGVKKIKGIRLLKNPRKKRVRRTAKGMMVGRTKLRRKAIVSLPEEESLMEYFQPG
ncbi:50S ribosomal protein L23 [bacterium]|nr:50S ribosomal protein L23 [bacterium]